MGLYIMAWIIATIAGYVLTKKKYMNYQHGIVWKKESKISDYVDNGFELKPVMPMAEKQPFYDKVMFAIDNLKESEYVKNELRRLVNSNEQKIYFNNDIKYRYCKLIDACLKETYRLNNEGNWINDLQSDISAGVFDVLEKKVILDYEYQYVTPRVFELNARIKNDMGDKLQYFCKEDMILRTLLQEFRKDLVGSSLGYTGESRMEKELKPYEGQIIALPNIRLAM